MEPQTQTATPPQPRAVARRVPGLEATTARVQVDVEDGRSQAFAIHDGIIEPVQTNGPVDAVIVFDDQSYVDQLLSGKLNPLVAALRGRLRVSGNVALVATLLFELQGQTTAGRSTAGEA